MLLLGFSDVITDQDLHFARAITKGSASGIILGDYQLSAPNIYFTNNSNKLSVL